MKGLKGDYAGNALAFENPDGSIILEILNPFDDMQEVTFHIKGINYNFNMKAHSFNTLIIDGWFILLQKLFWQKA